MSIHTSFNIPGILPKKPAGKKAVQFQGTRSLTSGKPSKDSVHFGRSAKNGIWVTTECSPYVKNGGLGEVSQTIPNAFSNYTDKDLRIIVPYEKANQEHDQKNPSNPFRKTNLTLKVKLNNDEPTAEFEVLQKFEPALNEQPGKGNWVYALKNPMWLPDGSNKSGRQKKTTTDDEGLSQYTYDGPQQKSLEKVLLFSRAAGALIPYLSQDGPAIDAPKADQTALHRFNDHVDFVIGNDWLSGPVLYSPEMQQDSRIRKIFMLHNTYDNIQGGGFIEHIGQPVPAYFKNVTDDYSPLTLALKSADAVIANRNYVKTITETPFKKGQEFVKILKEHSDAGRVFDMHHGLAEDFTPKDNQALRENYASWQASLIPALEPIAKAPAGKRADVEKGARQTIEKSAPRLDKLSLGLDRIIPQIEGLAAYKASIEQRTIARLTGRQANLEAAAKALIPMIERTPTDAVGRLTPQDTENLANTAEVAQLVPNPAEREAWLNTMTPMIKNAARLKTNSVQAAMDAIRQMPTTAGELLPQLNYQFEELQGDTPEDWQRFKAANKAALQVKYGLKPDPNAVILSWAARLDPYQKGFYLVQNTLETLLNDNPQLQVVIAGPTDDPSLKAWIRRMNDNPAYQGRFYMPNKFVDKTAIAQINAGSDFVMLPSLYEPYGLTQLEAMKMGSNPIVYGVDGLRTTVSDPLVNGKDFIGRSRTGKEDIKNKDEIAWFDPDNNQEWQTGTLMRPMRALHGPENPDTKNAWAPEAEFTKHWEPGLIKENEPAHFAVDVPGYQAGLDYEIAMRHLELHVSEGKPLYYKPKKKEDRKIFRAQADRMVELLDKVLKENKKRVEENKKRVAAQKAPLDLIFTEEEVTKVTKLRTRLNRYMPKFTYEDKTQIFDRILRPKMIDIVTKPAESSFMDAIQRAVDMTPEQRIAVRANAKRYVDTAHTWQSIVERYKAAIDSDSDFKAEPLKFHTDPSFKLAKPPVTAKKADADESTASTPPAPKSLGEQIMDWLLFLINPMAWWRSFRLRFS